MHHVQAKSCPVVSGRGHLCPRHPLLYAVQEVCDHAEQFKTDSHGSELLPEAANTCLSQGKPIWMLIPQSQGASEEAGTGRCAGSLIK